MRSRPGKARMRRVAPRPSRRGICMSMRMRSWGALRQARGRFAVGGEIGDEIDRRQQFPRHFAIDEIVPGDQHRRPPQSRRRVSAASAAAGLRRGCRRLGQARQNQKRLPAPTALLKPTSPPISSARRR